MFPVANYNLTISSKSIFCGLFFEADNREGLKVVVMRWGVGGWVEGTISTKKQIELEYQPTVPQLNVL